jgi:hypothetical protein
MTTNDREALLRTIHQDIQRITRELVEEMQGRKLDMNAIYRFERPLGAIISAAGNLTDALRAYHQLEYKLEELHRKSTDDG